MMIRPIVPTDRDALVDMVSASFRPDEGVVALELIDDAIAGSDDYWILVAADVPGPAHGMGGYICYGPTPMTASTYDLYWIVTHPQARGRGVAGALIQAMEAELGRRRATGVRVETSETESYGAARRLYARHEYPQVAHLVDFYRSGDGLIIYYKRL
jgi:GNAT superfamily N-acetyltransferase